MALFSCGCNKNCRFVWKGTFVFTDPTPDTELVNDVGLLDHNFPALIVGNGGCFELYGFIRGGTVFLTHYTGNPFGIGQAPVLVKKSVTDLKGVFFLH
jgi:hypothetical protein